MNFQLARTNMVAQQVRPWHVLNENVLAVLSQIPREIFVPADYLNLAYSDTDIPLPEAQTMLSPKIVGRALASLDLVGTEKSLEIGTGTGYMTACLSKLCNSVVSLEIQPALLAQAEKNLSAQQCRNVTLEQDNGVLGWTGSAPYDVIVVTGSYPLGIPKDLGQQLKIGGRLFAVCGQSPAMQAVMIKRHASGYTTTTLFETWVPPLIHSAKPQKFIF